MFLFFIYITIVTKEKEFMSVKGMEGGLIGGRKKGANNVNIALRVVLFTVLQISLQGAVGGSWVS